MIEHDNPQQLSLLPSSDVPVRFRLDAETRARGLRHIAEIRRQLAERQAARQPVDRLPVRIPVRQAA
jgi:hypothetical protein